MTEVLPASTWNLFSGLEKIQDDGIEGFFPKLYCSVMTILWHLNYCASNQNGMFCSITFISQTCVLEMCLQCIWSVVLLQVREFYPLMSICFSAPWLWELEVSFTWREQMLKVPAPASLIPNTLEEEKRSITQIGIFLMVRKGGKRQ